MEILQYLRSTADAKGIPTLNKQEWQAFNQLYDKETIVSALIEYIRIYKPEPPTLPITESEMIDSFRSLCNQDWRKFYLPQHEVIGKVLEKYDDYKHSFDECGLGVIQMGNKHLDLSNYFNQTLRMECDTYGFRSAHHRWKTATDLRPVMLALWRLGNDQLCEKSFVVAFRVATYIATQFKPHVAKTIYDMTDSISIFDSSCGWGDRLAGFYCSDAKFYTGCDPNPETFDMYKKQCIAYENLLSNGTPIVRESKNWFHCIGTKEVTIYRCAAEDLDFTKFPKFDCAFTSPPYFSTEKYNAGGKFEEDQSWKRYDNYEKWRDKFFLPVNERTFEHLNDGGIQIVNIQDPQIHGKRYRASDDLIERLTDKYQANFLGNLGMRIMQRPKNVSKTKLQTHFSKLYIEPCWCFGKKRNSLVLPKVKGLTQYM